MLVSLFGVLAVIIAAVGIAGVLAFSFVRALTVECQHAGNADGRNHAARTPNNDTSTAFSRRGATL